jgi:RES domain-containing protein
MEVYRIAKCLYINDMDGTGPKMYGARWNSKGHPVIYTAGSRALAALEALAHIPQKNLPKDFCIAIIHIPDHIPVKTLVAKNLPKGWRTIPIQTSLQKIGDRWLKNRKQALLRVPSVIIPEEWNYLINPLHPDAKKIKIKNTFPFVFDERLKDERV